MDDKVMTEKPKCNNMGKVIETWMTGDDECIA